MPETRMYWMLVALLVCGVAIWSLRPGGVESRATQEALLMSPIESPSRSWVAGKRKEAGGWVLELVGRGGHFETLPDQPQAEVLYWSWGEGDRLWLYEAGTFRTWAHDGQTWTRTDWAPSEGDVDWLCGGEPPAGLVPPRELAPLALTDAMREAFGEGCLAPLWVE